MVVEALKYQVLRHVSPRESVGEEKADAHPKEHIRKPPFLREEKTHHWYPTGLNRLYWKERKDRIMNPFKPSVGPPIGKEQINWQ